MIILLTGGNRVGKDTFYNIIKSIPFYSGLVERYAFADSLKSIVSLIYSVSEKELNDNKDIPFYGKYTGRDLLKYVGKTIRTDLNDIPFINNGIELSNSYANAVIKKINQSSRTIHIITDLRFNEEYDEIIKYYPSCTVVEIRKPPNTDKPEILKTIRPNIIINNTGTIEEYAKKVQKVVDTIQINRHIEFSKNQPAQCSLEWFQLRKGIFTASNCCLIKNPSKNFFGKKLEELVYEKKNKILPPPLNNYAINHGKLYEDTAARFFTKYIHPGTIHHDSALIFNKRYDFIAASPDGFITGDKMPYLMEIKCPSRKDIDNLPSYYNDQMQMQMMVTQIPRCFYLAVKIIETQSLYGIPENKVCGISEYPKHESNEDGTLIIFPQMLYDNQAELINKVSEIKGTPGKRRAYYYIEHYFMKEVYADVKWQAEFNIALDSVLRENDMGNVSQIVIEEANEFLAENPDEIPQLQPPIPKPVSEYDVTITKSGNWTYYTNRPDIFHPSATPKDYGKWMYFFNNREFAESMCLQAIKTGIAEMANCSQEKKGVCCFYIDGMNDDRHKRVINFFIENKLIQKTSAGKLYNISFKFSNGEHENIKLDKYVDLFTGLFI